MNGNYYPSSGHLRHGNTSFKDHHTPLRFSQTIRISPTPRHHRTWVEDKHDSMPSYRTSTSSSSTTLEKHLYKPMLCPGDQAIMGRKRITKESPS